MQTKAMSIGRSLASCWASVTCIARTFAVIGPEFGITQSAVSQHLKVLRDRGFATVRAEGTRRVYAVDPRPLADVDAWLDRFRRFWEPHLDALATEIARGKRARKQRR